AADAWLARLEQAGLFDQLDALAEETCFVPPVEAPLESRPAPWLGQARVLATVCALRLAQAHEAGGEDGEGGADQEEVVRSFTHLLAIERAASSEISIIARLVGLAVRALGVKAV